MWDLSYDSLISCGSRLSSSIVIMQAVDANTIVPYFNKSRRTQKTIFCVQKTMWKQCVEQCGNTVWTRMSDFLHALKQNQKGTSQLFP